MEGKRPKIKCHEMSSKTQAWPGLGRACESLEELRFSPKITGERTTDGFSGSRWGSPHCCTERGSEQGRSRKPSEVTRLLLIRRGHGFGQTEAGGGE